MHKRQLIKLIMIMIFLTFISSFVITCGKNEAEKQKARQERLQWFVDAKFGMFIHWGVYSMLGYHEWVRHQAQIPLAEYQYYVDNFDPIQFNPDEWVNLAKEAGMRYMIITSKHHDGYCIYNSEFTDYDIMHSKYGRDALGMLNEACKRLRMPLGFYYSIMDWHHPDYIPRRHWETDRSADDADLNRYINWMKKQLKELVQKYDPDVMWFDGEWEHSLEELHAFEIEKMLLDLNPKMLINDRLFKRTPGHGDFGTPENFVPATGIQNPDGSPAVWEACYTTNFNSWGYNHYETEFHSTTQLIRQLIEIVSKGGNLLLNVGPTPEGTIQPEFVARLRGIGEWLRVNGESIYGTSPSVFPKLPFFGRCTVKGNRLYLHVMGWPVDQRLLLPGLNTKVKRAYLLIKLDDDLNFKRDGNDVIIRLPERAPDLDATVIVVDLVEKPEIIGHYEVRPDDKGQIELPIYLAEIQSRMGQRAFLEQYHKKTMLTNWQNVYDYPIWEFSTPESTTYEVKLSYAQGSRESTFMVKIDDHEIPGIVQRSHSWMYPETFSVGTVQLASGKHNLEVHLKSIINNNAMRLEKVMLVPLSE